jgi:hypothetical protein
MLGVKKQLSIGRPIQNYIVPTDRPIFRTHLMEAFRTHTRQDCEIYLKRTNGVAVPVQLQSIATSSGKGTDDSCRTVVSDITARKQAELAVQESGEKLTTALAAELGLEKLVLELQKALAEIKVLRGILPICSYCKKIRDDEGSWRQMETYIRDHSEAEFTHGMCPDCAKKMQEEMNNFLNNKPRT